MIIDSHDGMVATVRITNDEAAVLKLALESTSYVFQEHIARVQPNVCTEHLEMLLRQISRGKTS